MVWFFEDKKTRLMKRAETAMVWMGQAAQADNLRALHAATRAQLSALQAMHIEGVTEAEFEEFIAKRGRLPWTADKTMQKLMAEKVQQAEALYGFF